MEINEIIDTLSQTAVFNGLGNNQIRALATACHYTKYSMGEEIVKEGAQGDGLYIIIEGKLSVLLPKNSSSGFTTVHFLQLLFKNRIE